VANERVSNPFIAGHSFLPLSEGVPLDDE